MRSKARSENSSTHQVDDRHADSGTGPAKKIRRRKWPLLCVLLALLLVAAWMSPMIITRTRLRNELLGWVYPELVGRVSIGSASAGWTSSITLRDVTLLDGAGQKLIVLQEFHTSKSLQQLLVDQTDLGELSIEQLALNVAVRSGGSNLEDTLAIFMQDTGAAGGPIPKFKLQVTNSAIFLADATTGVACKLQNMHADVDSLADGIHVKANAETQMDGTTGTFAVGGTWPADATSGTGMPPVVIQGQQLPLGLFEPVLARFGVSGRLHGLCQLRCEIDCDPTKSPWSIGVTGEFAGDNCQVRIAEYLGEDVLQVPSLKANIKSTVTADWLHVDKCDITTDVLRLNGDGRLPISLLTSGNWAMLWRERGPDVRLRLEGEADIARLAAMVPQLLQLRNGTVIDSGEVGFRLRSDVVEGERKLNIHAKTNQLAARRDGQSIQWSEPIELEAVVTTQNGLTVIEQLKGSSDFIALEGSGHETAGSAVISIDLSQVADKLTQFVDCGIDSMQGSVRCNMRWDSNAPDFRQIDGDMTIDQLSVKMSAGNTWTEPTLRIVGQAECLVTQSRLARVDQLKIGLQAGNDGAAIHLASPTMVTDNMSRLPFHLECQGDLTSWTDRLRPWVSLSDLRMAGTIHAQADIEASSDSVLITTSQIDAKNVQVTGCGLGIQESVVRLETKGVWQRATSKTSLSDVTFTSTSVAARGANIVIGPNPEGEFGAQGDIAARGDLLRFSQWFPSLVSPNHRVRGEFELRTNINSRASAILADGAVTVKPFVYETLASPAAITPVSTSVSPTASGWQPVWNDNQLQVLASARYDWSTDEANFEKLYVVGEGVRATAKGSIATIQVNPTANIEGQLEYDLQTVMAKLYNFVGPGVLLRGKQTQPFRFQGPLTAQSFQVGGTNPANRQALSLPANASPTTAMLVSPELTGEATLGWEIAKIYGVTINSTELKAQLRNGVIEMNPIQVAIGDQGRIAIAPRVELNGPTPQVVLPASRMAENVQITPEMCRTWLRYVTPLLSNATTVDGAFSAEIGGLAVPLNEPKRAAGSGSITIHQARLRPGPMADQVMGIVDQLGTITGSAGKRLNFLRSEETWIEIADQKVDFMVQDGKVYHKQLEVHVDDMVIRTTGWVGMDQTVSLVAEIPVLDKWVANERFLAGLKGQSLRVPVYGSLGQPQLDLASIRQMTKQMIGGATQQLLQDEVRKGLQGGLEKLLQNR